MAAGFDRYSQVMQDIKLHEGRPSALGTCPVFVGGIVLAIFRVFLVGLVCNFSIE